MASHVVSSKPGGIAHSPASHDQGSPLSFYIQVDTVLRNTPTSKDKRQGATTEETADAIIHFVRDF